MKAAGEGKHKIKMDPGMKDFRANGFTSFEPTKFNQELIKQLTKPERAEMVYRFHLAGVKIAPLCQLYGISQGYQRELRGLKEKEWAMNLLNCDEEFIQFIKEFKTKYPKELFENPDDLVTPGSFAVCIMFPEYLLSGCRETSAEEYMTECNEIMQAFSKAPKGKAQPKCLKSVEVET